MTAGPADDPAPDAITIVLAEDHRVVRAGLRLLLDAEADLRVVAEAGDVAETERSAAVHRPRVLVLDLDLPDGSAIPAIPRLRRALPQTRILILTMHGDPALAREALAAGASGYIVKDAAREELVGAIRSAAAGRVPVSPGLRAPAPGVVPPTPGPAPAAPAPLGTDGLSARELEVLGLLALGHTNAEIAARLYLSVRTVESHRSNIQHKTGRTSRAELVAYARERGIV